MMEVDSTSLVTVPGSRWPIIISKPRSSSATTDLTPAPISKEAPQAPPSSIRRKPRITYRSPDADSPLHIEELRKLAPTLPSTTFVAKPGQITPPTPYLTPRIPTRSQSPVFKPAPPIFKMRPPLPVYHPLGPSPIAPLQDGPNEFSVKQKSRDNALIRDEHDSRRSSSRARKPAAKVREAEDHDVEDDVFAEPLVETGSTSARGAASPSKRKRANGTNGPARKKRKDAGTADRDGTYPNRRTRRTHAQTNLANDGNDVEDVSPTDSNVPGSPGEGDPDAEANSNAKKTTRTRRPRMAAASANLRRRGSSASEATATSVSVSIAGTLAAGKDAPLETAAG